MMSSPAWVFSALKKLYPARNLAAGIIRSSRILQHLVKFVFFHQDTLFFLAKDSLVKDLHFSSADALHNNNAGSAYVNQPARVKIVVQEAIPAQEDAILPSQVVRHFIDQASHIFIMDTCLCRDSLGCQDYPRDLGCIFLGEAAARINPDLGRHASRDEANAHLDRAIDAGLVHMVGRNQLDSIWLGVGPREKLLTICHCCPCCCLYRVAGKLSPEISRVMHHMPGVYVTIRPDLCSGCGICVSSKICFMEAISMIHGRAVINSDCKSCGRCVERCPRGAIHITFTQPDANLRIIEEIQKSVSVN